MNEEQIPPQTDTTNPSEPVAESTQPVDPAATTTDHPARPWLREPEGHGKKKALLITALAVAILLVIGAAGAAYALWYQSPDKQLTDALAAALSSKTATGSGNVTSTSSDMNLALDFDGQLGLKEGASMNSTLTAKPSNSTAIKLPINAVIVGGGDSYVKLSNLKQAVSTLMGSAIGSLAGDLPAAISNQIQSSITASISPLVTQVDGKWIRLTQSDANSLSPQASKQYACVTSAYNDLRQDTSSLIQLAVLYSQHKALVVKAKLGSQNGSVGYVVDIDQNAVKQIIDGMKNTKVSKDLQACSNTTSSDQTSGTTTPAISHVEVWIDQWSHQFTRINGSVGNPVDSSSVVFDLKPKFNQSVQITPPSGAVPYQSVKPAIDKLLGTDGGMSPLSLGGL